MFAFLAVEDIDLSFLRRESGNLFPVLHRRSAVLAVDVADAGFISAFIFDHSVNLLLSAALRCSGIPCRPGTHRPGSESDTRRIPRLPVSKETRRNSVRRGRGFSGTKDCGYCSRARPDTRTR